jgi:hypothetical protein
MLYYILPSSKYIQGYAYLSLHLNTFRVNMLYLDRHVVVQVEGQRDREKRFSQLKGDSS